MLGTSFLTASIELPGYKYDSNVAADRRRMLCRANEPHLVFRYLLPSDTHNLFPPSAPLGLLHSALVLLGKWNDKELLGGFLVLCR